jgi:AcrR family transcriptional regulator
MNTRTAAMELTRERILEIAGAQFMDRPYEEVTLRGVAREAGVALQTVVNHFGAKEDLFMACVERLGREIEERRAAQPGDIAGAVRALVDDYEITGDGTIRALPLEERIPALAAGLRQGRENHEAWVQVTFPAALRGLRGAARQRRVAQLVAVTDVYTWKLLRRDRGFTADQTATTMQELVERLHDDHEESR